MKTIYLQILSFLFLTLILSSLNSCKESKKEITPFVDSLNLVKTMPEWAKNCNIYEVNIRQYTTEGTFKAFQEHLPRLKEMGVDILWLMPINPIGVLNRKGSLGSYYSISDYKALNQEYGTLEDFKNLVNKAHELKMYIIIDWVANHSSWDNAWIEENSDWYTQDSLGQIVVPGGTDWSDVADLNYDNKDMRKAMIDAMAYWVTEADIDGFRCDVASWVPTDFWKRARYTIDSIKPNCFFLAEASEQFMHEAFDMSYGWPGKDVINAVAKGEKDASAIMTLVMEEAAVLKPEDVRMNFITNHDENTWSGSEYERLGDTAVDAFTVLIYTIPGMPLTYSGQEEPLKKRLSFFDKDTINFKNYDKAALLTSLNTLKKDNKALWNSTYGGNITFLKNSLPESIVSFERQKDENKVLCIFNLTDKEQSFKITDDITGIFTKYLGVDFKIAKNIEYKLKPWEYSVLISNEQ